MNIGFDLDKVFVDYPPIIPNWLIDKLYKEKDNNILLYRIPGKIEQCIRQISHNPLIRAPLLKNISFLKKLHETYPESLFLISSRFSFLKKQTTFITHLYGLDKIFKTMFFNYNDLQPHIFKDAVIKKQQIAMYIDDDLSLIRYLAKNNPTVQFFWLNAKKNARIASNILAISDIQNILHAL